MNNVKAFVLAQLVDKQISRDKAKELLLELSGARLHQDVAVIGLAGRFAAATSVDQFWEFLLGERDYLRDFPQSRKQDMYDILRNPYYAELLLGAAVDEADLDRLYSLSGYMDRIDHFDARFFGIPPLEADYMDPHQRIALEVAYEALENAGYGGDSAKGSRTGVFLGRDQTNYSYYRMFSERSPLQLSGSWEGLVASRISYVFDLKGPCLMTDTACSAGAVGIHQAIQSLVLGECDMALAGGLNLSSGGEPKPSYMSGATMDNVVSPDSTVRTFDARADGTLWGEGAGIVLLKPLHRALADRDHVRAVIKASATNNDGSSTSITAPNAQMQEQAILDAWSKLDFSPETITYVEAHGTGTVLGDPIEVKGLSNAFRRHTARRQFCGIGSLKTSMGHMVAASGVAALAKVVKSLETATLAPSANFDVPNPYIDFTDSPLYVNDRAAPWESGGQPRRAGISSFGFIRTNCHMVLEEPPRYRTEAPGRDRYCFTVSGRSAAALDGLLAGYASMLADCPWSLADICYTANLGRGHHEHRVMIIAASREQLADSIDRLRRHGVGTEVEQGIFAGVHTLVSDKKRDLEPGDLTAQAGRRLSAAAEAGLAAYCTRGDRAALLNLADAYVGGATVAFAPYYADEARRRVPLPTYPYDQVRHWAKPLQSKVQGFGGAVRPHPLLGEQVGRSPSGIEFENTLSVDRHWVLADHRIQHRAVVPGTTYLEMARAAFATLEGAGGVQLENVFFLSPLAVEDQAGATVRTRLDRDGTGYTFSVTSRRGSTWLTHVKGRISSLGEPEPVPAVDLRQVQGLSTVVSDPYVGETDTGVFQFGPRWDSVRAVWHQEAGALTLLRLPPGVDDETASYGLHPAKLDNAVNLLSQASGQTFLPYVYKRFALHRRMPEEFYSLIRTARDDGPDGETITYDVDLLDSSGRPFAEIRSYTVKKVDWERFRLDGPRRGLEVGWTPAPALEASPAGGERWGVIGLPTAAGRQLVEDLRARGLAVTPCYLGATNDPDRAVFAPDEEGMERLCGRLVREQVQGVLFATDFTATDDLSHAERRRYGVDALFGVFHALLEHRVKPRRGLKVLGRDAWRVTDGDVVTDPYSAATAALGLVIGQEHRHLLVNVVDAAAGADRDVLTRECLAGSGTGWRAVRGSSAYVRELRPLDAAEDAEPSPYADGTFLLSGGAGGLGLTLAEHMVRHGARRILLLGRRPLDEPTADRVARLGVAEYVVCDVARPAEVQDLAVRLATEGVPLTGIVHAAGVAGDGFLAKKARPDFDAVLAPKIDGSVALLELARAHPEAFCVFFSSITAVTGGQGQGDYCCANAFLDSLAVRARAEGIKALSINWPAWSEAGMAVDHGLDDEGSPFRAVSVRDGLAWLDHLLRHPVAGVIPTELNPAALEDLGDLPFLVPAEMAATPGGSGAPAAVGDPVVEVRLTGVPDPTRTQLRVGGIYGTVLGLAEVDAYASFQDLGGNSLMTAQLLTMVEQAYPSAVDIADLFSYATVVDLAGYIDEQTAPTSATGIDGIRSADAGSDATAELKEVLDELDDEELFTIFDGADRNGGRSR